MAFSALPVFHQASPQDMLPPASSGGAAPPPCALTAGSRSQQGCPPTPTLQQLTSLLETLQRPHTCARHVEHDGARTIALPSFESEAVPDDMAGGLFYQTGAKRVSCADFSCEDLWQDETCPDDGLFVHEPADDLWQDEACPDDCFDMHFGQKAELAPYAASASKLPTTSVPPGRWTPTPQQPAAASWTCTAPIERVQLGSRPQRAHRSQVCLQEDSWQAVQEGRSLREVLQQLNALDDTSRILTIRKVRPLGQRVGPLLREHFGRYCAVDAVLTYVVRRGIDGHHVRAGDLAFVVLPSREQAQRILATGAPEYICGYVCPVMPFEGA